MFTQISRGKESSGPRSWLYHRIDVWSSDVPITKEAAEQLVKEQYGSFPVVYTKTTISDDQMQLTVYIEEDNCQ